MEFLPGFHRAGRFPTRNNLREASEAKCEPRFHRGRNERCTLGMCAIVPPALSSPSFRNNYNVALVSRFNLQYNH
jgi:hypothetical protein